MAITAFKRYEMKFMLTKKQFDKIIPAITEHMNPDAYCQNGKNYSIYNIYYDTTDSYFIRTSLSKPYYKEKLRLRSYASPAAPDDKVFLELKKKTGGIVHKRRAVMTLKEAQDFITYQKRPEAKGYMNEQVIRELAYFLSQNQVYPAAYIAYDRMAFFGKDDKDFRITFDRNITTRRKDLQLSRGRYGKQLLEKDQYLMEVKISSSVPVWLADLLCDLQIYKTSFSKYGTEYKHYCLEEVKRDKTAHPVDLTVNIPQTKLCANY